MLFIHIGLTDFERMLLIAIDLETQSAIEPACGFLWDRHTQRDLLKAGVAAHSVQELYQHGFRHPLAPCCRSHIYAPDSPFVALFAPFVPDEPGLTDHVPAREGSNHEVALRRGAESGGDALGRPRVLILWRTCKGMGLAC